MVSSFQNLADGICCVEAICENKLQNNFWAAQSDCVGYYAQAASKGPHRVRSVVDAEGIVGGNYAVAFFFDPFFDVGIFEDMECSWDFDVFDCFRADECVVGSAADFEDLPGDP